MQMVRILIITILVLILDQGSKYWVVEHMDLKTLGAIDVFPPYLNFRMAWNDGINFGLGGGTNRWILIGLSLVISVAVLFWARNKSGWLIPVCTGAIIGGALGNVWDRLMPPKYAVVDFLNMSCCGINNPFAFNVADVAIFAGAFGLILFGDRPTEPKS